MKYNLKMLKEDYLLHEYWKWVEGFEAELREILKRERFKEKGYCPVWDNAYDYAIKEILGE